MNEIKWIFCSFFSPKRRKEKKVKWKNLDRITKSFENLFSSFKPRWCYFIITFLPRTITVSEFVWRFIWYASVTPQCTHFPFSQAPMRFLDWNFSWYPSVDILRTQISLTFCVYVMFQYVRVRRVYNDAAAVGGRLSSVQIRLMNETRWL